MASGTAINADKTAELNESKTVLKNRSMPNNYLIKMSYQFH